MQRYVARKISAFDDRVLDELATDTKNWESCLRW